MSALTDALVAIRRGWWVFPMTREKRPAHGLGLRSATNDPEQARLLFGTPGAELVAIATGKLSGVAALDVDPDALGWFGQRYSKSLRRTWSQRTPRGGWHLLYRWPPGLRCSVGKIHRGVDIRGEGGSVVIAGPGYVMVDDIPPAPFPGWLRGALMTPDDARERRATHRNSGEPARDVEALAKWVSQLGVGERNHGLFWAACRAGANAWGLKTAALSLPLAPKETLHTWEQQVDATIKSAMRTVR